MFPAVEQEKKKDCLRMLSVSGASGGNAFEAVVDGYLGDFAWSDANADTQWGRFRCQICSLHTFWREPLVEPHEQHRIRHWYRRVAARAVRMQLEAAPPRGHGLEIAHAAPLHTATPSGHGVACRSVTTSP